MRIRGVSLAIGLVAAPFAANAQPFQGLYIGAGAGYNLPQDVFVQTRAPISPRARLVTQGGVTGLGSVGYGFGNGLRIEVEGNYRHVGVNHVSGRTEAGANGTLNTYGAMANLLFDMDIGVPWLFPYLGGGAGYAWTHMDNLTIHSPATPVFPAESARNNGTQGGFAYQLIAGLSFPVPSVPGLSLTTEYRFFARPGNETFSSVDTRSATPTTFTIRQQYNHSFLLGVRYAFNVAAPVPVAAAAQPAPAAAAARSYLVFFDWDKATLTDRARQIVREAADNSTRVQYTRIEVNGYTDTSGTAQYNQGLSLRRAQAVQAELVRDGVPANTITIQGFGDTKLLVPTGPGVREPQNRRVEIIIR
jgi:OmpA-OmpF porin, OOP family